MEFCNVLAAQGTGGVVFELVQDDEVRVVVEVLLQEAQAANALLVSCPLRQQLL
ncbi:hypothetical protein ACWCWQ_16910 [Streptomyces sp. NPDC001571]